VKNSSFKDLIEIRIRKLSKRVRININSVFYRFLIQIFDSEQTSASHEDAHNEYRKLMLILANKKNPEVCVWIDQDYSAPGFGDLLVAIGLANQLYQLGFATSFFWSQDIESSIKREKEETVRLFLNKKITMLDKNQMHAVSPESIVFSNRVSNHLDVSVPALQLLILMDRNTIPDKAQRSPTWPIDIENNLTPKTRPTVGIHVRRSRHAEFRNPSNYLTFRDIKRLATLFQNCDLIWFGEFDHYLSFQEIYRRHLDEAKIKLRFQENRGFSRVALEALRCDFWFQRWGGGIGAVHWFWDTPYLMISNDYVLRRVFKIKDRKIVSWANRNQIYDLRWFRSRQRIMKRFVHLPKSKTGNES
jgi:hypothetical protein